MDNNDAEVIRTAIWVVDSFDQANTNGVVTERLGSRGAQLEKAVNELRNILNRNCQQTCLTEEQARH